MIVPAHNVKSGTGLSFRQHFPHDALNRHKKAPPTLSGAFGKTFL
jgi:hypothetical protein